MATIKPVKPLGKFVSVRVDPKVHNAFHRKAKQFGRTSDVLREFIEAFLEDRLVVTPSPNKRSLYHVD